MKVITILLLVFCITQSTAQTIEAHYTVKRTFSFETDPGKKTSIDLLYDGHIYKSNAKIISFLKPLYLPDYPSGLVDLPVSENGTTNQFILDIDTVQFISIHNTDSLRFWTYNYRSLAPKEFVSFIYKPNSTFWKILPDTKIINGLECKHAVRIYKEKIIMEIWYYPKIDLGFGLMGLRDIPGLVVEYTSDNTGFTYSLKDFKLNEPIDDSVFWPEIFKKAKFNENTGLKSGKDSKKSSIMNQ